MSDKITFFCDQHSLYTVIPYKLFSLSKILCAYFKSCAALCFFYIKWHLHHSMRLARIHLSIYHKHPFHIRCQLVCHYYLVYLLFILLFNSPLGTLSSIIYLLSSGLIHLLVSTNTLTNLLHPHLRLAQRLFCLFVILFYLILLISIPSCQQIS